MTALFLVLPTVLIAGWMAMWLVHKPLRWLWYFGGGLALMLLIVAGLFLRPHHPCQDSGLACADDYSFFATVNLLAGFGTWLVLLILTALAEAAVAIDSRVRPAERGDDRGGPGKAAGQAVIAGAGAAEPHPLELTDRRDPGGGIP